MKNKTLEALLNWAHAVTDASQRSMNDCGLIVTAEQVGDAMRELNDAIQQEEVSDEN